MTDTHIRRQALSLDPTIAETRLRGPVRLSEFKTIKTIHPEEREHLGVVKAEVMICRDENNDPVYLEHWSYGAMK